jgi:hypothetical protein
MASDQEESKGASKAPFKASSKARSSAAESRSLSRRKRERMKDRDSTFWKVLNAALELDFRKGNLKWTMSELSRKSGITRSLIYYHFGRSKTAILNEAIVVIGEEIIATGPDRVALWREGKWAETVKLSREVASQAPHLCNFYLLHRDRPTDIGQNIRNLESAYIRKLQKLFPELPAAGIKALFAFFFGICFAPNVDDEAVKVAIQGLRRLTRR